MQEQKMISTNSQAQNYAPTLFDIERQEKKAKREKKENKEKREKEPTKKDTILGLYFAGTTDVELLAQRVGTRPSYVADVLHRAGLLPGYHELYTTTSRDQNVYSKFFRNVLSFKSPEAARESVDRIESLYRYFERIGDRAGQHHAQVIALTGRNRARWSGKLEEAQIFTDWLLKT